MLSWSLWKQNNANYNSTKQNQKHLFSDDVQRAFSDIRPMAAWLYKLKAPKEMHKAGKQATRENKKKANNDAAHISIDVALQILRKGEHVLRHCRVLVNNLQMDRNKGPQAYAELAYRLVIHILINGGVRPVEVKNSEYVFTTHEENPYWMSCNARAKNGHGDLTPTLIEASILVDAIACVRGMTWKGYGKDDNKADQTPTRIKHTKKELKEFGIIDKNGKAKYGYAQMRSLFGEMAWIKRDEQNKYMLHAEKDDFIRCSRVHADSAAGDESDRAYKKIVVDL